jgi:hypothetical protein
MESFHPFPRLPKELRLEIWRHGLPEPRLINFNLMIHNIRRRRFVDRDLFWTAQSTPLSQCLRLVNCEARDVFNEAYHLMVLRKEGNQHGTSILQVDHTMDTMYFGSQIPEQQGIDADVDDSSCLFIRGELRWPGRTKVQRIALNLNIMQKFSLGRHEFYLGFSLLVVDPSTYAVGLIEQVLSAFPALKVLNLVVNPEFQGPRVMVDLLGSPEYDSWVKLHGPGPVWIPETLATLNSQRTAKERLKIVLTIFQSLPGAAGNPVS